MNNCDHEEIYLHSNDENNFDCPNCGTTLICE